LVELFDFLFRSWLLFLNFFCYHLSLFFGSSATSCEMTDRLYILLDRYTTWTFLFPLFVLFLLILNSIFESFLKDSRRNQRILLFKFYQQLKNILQEGILIIFLHKVRKGLIIFAPKKPSIHDQPYQFKSISLFHKKGTHLFSTVTLYICSDLGKVDLSLELIVDLPSEEAFAID